jgi:hypothetical protein
MAQEQQLNLEKFYGLAVDGLVYPGSLSIADNVQLLESGDIERRRATHVFGDAITVTPGVGVHSMFCLPKSDGNKYIFVDVGETVKASVLTGAPALSATTFTDAVADLDPDFEFATWSILKDKAFRVDGVNNNLVFSSDSVITECGVTAPVIATLAATTGGTITAGAYEVYYTYLKVVSGYTVESYPSPVATITIGTNAINATVTESDDANVTKIRLYRNLYGETGTYYLSQETTNDSNTVKMTNGDEDIRGNTTLNFYTGVPPQAKYCIGTGSRMWYANLPDTTPEGSSMLMWSNVDAPEEVYALNYQTFDVNDGDEITGLGELQNNLIVFKHKKTWLVDKFSVDIVDGVVSITKHELSKNIGCVSQATICPTGESNSIFFLSHEGVIVYDGQEFKNVSKHRVNKIILDDFLSNGATARAQYYPYEREYHLILTTSADGDFTDQVHLVYHIECDGWTTYSYYSGDVKLYETGTVKFPDDYNKEVLVSANIFSTSGVLTQLDYDAAVDTVKLLDSVGAAKDGAPTVYSMDNPSSSCAVDFDGNALLNVAIFADATSDTKGVVYAVDKYGEEKLCVATRSDLKTLDHGTYTYLYVTSSQESHYEDSNMDYIFSYFYASGGNIVYNFVAGRDIDLVQNINFSTPAAKGYIGNACSRYWATGYPVAAYTSLGIRSDQTGSIPLKFMQSRQYVNAANYWLFDTRLRNIQSNSDPLYQDDSYNLDYFFITNLSTIKTYFCYLKPAYLKDSGETVELTTDIINDCILLELSMWSMPTDVQINTICQNNYFNSKGFWFQNRYTYAGMYYYKILNITYDGTAIWSETLGSARRINNIYSPGTVLLNDNGTTNNEYGTSIAKKYFMESSYESNADGTWRGYINESNYKKSTDIQFNTDSTPAICGMAVYDSVANYFTLCRRNSNDVYLFKYTPNSLWIGIKADIIENWWTNKTIEDSLALDSVTMNVVSNFFTPGGTSGEWITKTYARNAYLMTCSTNAIIGEFYVESDYTWRSYFHTTGETVVPDGAMTGWPIFSGGNGSDWVSDFDQTVESWDRHRIDFNLNAHSVRFKIYIGTMAGSANGTLRIKYPTIKFQPSARR